MDMQRGLRLLTIVLLATSVCAETIYIKPTVLYRKILPSGSWVHAIYSHDGRTTLLSSTEQQPNGKMWLQVEDGRVISHRDVQVPLAVPVAISEQLLVWSTGSASGTKLNIMTPVTGESKSFELALRDVTHLAIVESDLYAIATNRDRSLQLYQVSSVDGGIHDLGQVSSEPSAISFGQSGNGRLVLIDNAAGRFREDTIAGSYARGTWRKIVSPILEVARSKNSSPRLGFSNLILQHWLLPSGNQGFVIAHRGPSRGQYAIETNNEGQQVREFLLENWLGKAAEVGPAGPLLRTLAGSGTLQHTGDFVVYEGLR